MKTIEQAAEEYAQKVYPKIKGEHEVNIDGAIIANSANSFIAGAAFARHWINIEDNLPEKGTEFLGKNMNGEVTDNDLYTKDREIVEGEKTKHLLLKRTSELDLECIEILKSYKVTHWRPIEIK